MCVRAAACVTALTPVAITSNNQSKLVAQREQSANAVLLRRHGLIVP